MIAKRIFFKKNLRMFFFFLTLQRISYAYARMRIIIGKTTTKNNIIN